MANLATAAEKSRAIVIPSTEVARVRETSFPQSAQVLARVGLLRHEAAVCGGVELDRPTFANQPLIECRGFAFDRTNPDPPLLVDRVRPFVFAANGPISDIRA